VAHSLSDDQVRLLRLSAQRLDSRRARSVTGVRQVVKDVCGVQAQDASAAALAVRARCAGIVASDVEDARVQERSVVRTWCMRGTLHLLATEDLGWLLALLGPIFIRSGRRRRAELGLDEDTCARGVRIIRDVLTSRGPLTRAEIAGQLATRSIRTAGQATIHLIGLAALEGVICLGPVRGREPTYVVLADWIGQLPALSREKALAELARRYLMAYSPATPEDLAAWSGLALREARAGWQQVTTQLIEVKIGGSSAWMLKAQARWLDRAPARRPIVRLLPSYDTYLLGYRSRDLALAPKHAKRIHPGGGLLRPALLVDGKVIGAWKIERHRVRIDVVVKPFEDLTASAQRGLEVEVEDLAHFLGVEAELKVVISNQ
jgi:uncharacterized protein YcaQ